MYLDTNLNEILLIKIRIHNGKVYTTLYYGLTKRWLRVSGTEVQFYVFQIDQLVHGKDNLGTNQLFRCLLVQGH